MRIRPVQHTKALERTREVRLILYLALVPAVLYLGTKIYEWIQGEAVMSETWLWSLLKGAVMFVGLTLPYWFIRITPGQTQSSDGDDTEQTFQFSRDGFALSDKASLTRWGLMDRVNAASRNVVECA